MHQLQHYQHLHLLHFLHILHLMLHTAPRMYTPPNDREQAAHAEAMKTRAPSAMDLGLVPTSMTVRNAAAGR